VAILFADLVGFTEFCEPRDPEEITLFVRELFRDFTAVIERYGGYVDKYIGDAILALYGAPIAHEDDVERSVRAGLSLIEILQSRPTEGLAPLGLRVGVDVGEVVVGTLTSARTGDYTVTGDAVNTASRLQTAAEPNGLLISDAAYRSVRSLIVADPVPALRLKGKRDPVQAWAVRSMMPGAPRRVHRTPFVGREAELDTLLSWSAEARGGTPLAAMVEGEPGIGKSRLARELTERLESAGWRVLTAQVEPFAAAVFGPLRSIVRQAAADGSHSKLEREILALLEPPGSAAETRADDPEDAAARDRQRRLALSRMARSLARERPLAVIVEDAHWADPDSLDLLTALAEGRGPLPLFLVFTTRSPSLWPEWRPSALRVERLELAPLDPRTCGDMVLRMIDLPAGDARQLVERSGGNPLFLEELISASREQAFEVPDSIQGLLMSRLDQLPQGARTSVRLGAVLGDRFPRTVLRFLYDRALGVPGFEADVEFLLERGLFVQPEDAMLGFRHALTREVAYATELHQERRVLHGWAADAIERLQPPDERTLPLLAHHWSEAGEWGRAFPLVLSAGREALAQYALRESERWLEKAAGAVARGAVSAEAASLEILWRDLAEIRLHRAATGSALEAVERLAALVGNGASPSALARAGLLRGQAYWRQDRYEAAREQFEHALAAVPPDAVEERAELLNALGIAALQDDDPSLGEPFLLEALDTWERLGHGLGQAKAAVNLGNLMAAKSCLDEAERWYVRAITLGREIPDRLVITNNLTNLGMIRFWRGDLGPALSSFREAIELAEEMGLTGHVWHISENLGRCHLGSGDLRAAAAAFRRCEQGGAAGENLLRAYAALYLGRTYFAALATERARECWHEARRLAGERSEAGIEADLLLDEGRLAYVEGDTARARSLFERCWASGARRPYPWFITARGYVWVLDALLESKPPPAEAWGFEGPSPLRAIHHYHSACAWLALGEGREAGAHLATAIRLLDAMGEGLLARHAHFQAYRAALLDGHADRRLAAAHLERSQSLTLAIADRLPDDVPAAEFLEHPYNRAIGEAVLP
jgi:class 3 adenylate cyclase/tetratricopeptide (TPR) repeat protein